MKTEAVLGGGRGSPIVSWACHIGMYLLRAGLGMSLARIAGPFGRDRSTVAYACQVIEDLRDDRHFDIWTEQLSVCLSAQTGFQEAGSAFASA